MVAEDHKNKVVMLVMLYMLYIQEFNETFKVRYVLNANFHPELISDGRTLALYFTM